MNGDAIGGFMWMYCLVTVVGDLIETYEREQEPISVDEKPQWLS